MFFLGYFFFQVPGAVYAQRNSVKKLIFVSLILWGSLATLTGVVSNAYSLILIRFMLGVVEAAVMPAMLVYLCHWFTRAERSRANTFLILGNPVTMLWMSVVSGYLVQQRIPALRHVGTRIPGMPKPGKCLGSQRRQAFDVQIEERIELDPVRVFFLLIDVPQQGAPRPLRPHERVFTAHCVEITAP